jgi:hypothetical protein
MHHHSAGARGLSDTGRVIIGLVGLDSECAQNRIKANQIKSNQVISPSSTETVLDQASEIAARSGLLCGAPFGPAAGKSIGSPVLSALLVFF